MKTIWKLAFAIFSVVSILVTLITNQSNLFFSSYLKSDSQTFIESEVFTRMLASENHYFGQNLESKNESIVNNVIEISTNINFKDVRSLIYDEVPGLFTMTSQILVAGEKSDFTSLPIESAPPIEELLKEHEIIQESLEGLEEENVNPIEKPETNTVFIYHSHNRESFLPHLKDITNPNHAQHKDINITLAGERLGQRLMEKGIGVTVDKTDIASILHEQDLHYRQSYQVSRNVVKEALANNEQYTYLIDLHRDAARRDKTTVTIDGKNYAKLFFIVGKSHQNYKENEKFAYELHNLIKEKYPDLTRDVFGKDKTQGDGVYNQDLSSRAIIIEIGGVDNTLEEIYNTVDILAEVLAEYYWQDAVEVNN